MITILHAAAGIAIFATIQSIWLGSLSKNVRIFRSYAFVCGFIAIYLMATAYWYQAETLVEAGKAAKWQTFGGLGHIVAFTWLITFMAGAIRDKLYRKILVTYTVLMAALTLYTANAPLSLLTDSIQITGTTTLLHPQVTAFSATNTPGAIALNIIAFSTFAACFAGSLSIYKSRDRGDALWLGTYILFELASITYRVMLEGSITENQASGIWPAIWLLIVVSVCFGREHNRTVASLHAQEKQLKQRAYFDNLTQLPNELWLREELPTILARKQSERLLVFTHIHEFRAIRRIFGNEHADELLRQVAARIKTLVSPSDILAHMQDDTFCVLRQSPGFTRDHAGANDTRNTLHDSLLEPYYIGRQPVNLNFHMGIVDVSQPESIENAIYFGHLALADAAKQGSNTTTFFDNTLVEQADKERLLQEALPTALQNHELELYYQPKVNRQGKCEGAEALLRWHSSQYGFVSPADFIPLAERSGLMPDLGAWVIESACAFVSKIEKTGNKLSGRLSINVSPWQLLDGSLETILFETLSKYGVRPEAIELELTESALVDSRTAAYEQLKRIQNTGISIAVDDFGTGYSSLAYLQNLPLNVLKIDKQFVDKLHDHCSTQLVQGIVDIGLALNMQLIAEGVETKEQADILEKLGCHVYQGYYFSRPLPGDEFLDWLANHDLNDAQIFSITPNHQLS